MNHDHKYHYKINIIIVTHIIDFLMISQTIKS